ncbi:MAG: hypothetical protein N2036_15395 [Bryobacteraceae bacterium]|nr:hypothetical protein [Bryobacteraceae bacterium]MCX7605457.1 hypothetical protein [Bryobacteraceae bacterium]
MKIISLRRYLDRVGQADGRSRCAQTCLDFVEKLGRELGLQRGPEEEAAGESGVGGPPFGALLDQIRQWKAEQARREEQARVEMQWLLSAFNQAVVALAEGGDRAAERFAAVGQVLERAARADTLGSMRAAVHEAAEALRRESEAQRQDTAARVEALGRRLDEARSRQRPDRRERSGREEGVEAVRAAAASGRRAAVAGVVFERLPALEARFGRAVAEEALAGFEQERISALALEGRVYAWAPRMRVWLMEAGDENAVRERLEQALAEPFEYRTFAAGRRVTLALEGRWMWGLLGRVGTEALIEEVDLFAAGAPARR